MVGNTVELLLGGASFATPKRVTVGDADVTNGYVGFTVSGADLGADGSKSLTAKVTDVAGNAATGTALTFTKDTTTPAPAFALGTNVSGGATATEATQAGGVVTVKAESGASVTVTFSRTGGGTVTKNVIGTGTASAVAVTLTAGDLTTLGDGTISVSATATDAVGNTSVAGKTSFTLDTTPPTVVSVLATVGTITSGSATLKVGDVVKFTVNTSEAVTVTGAPALSLNSGGTATYTSGSGTTKLVFSYTVGVNDSPVADLTVLALLTSGGSITDGAGNPLATFTANPAGTLKIG